MRVLPGGSRLVSHLNEGKRRSSIESNGEERDWELLSVCTLGKGQSPLTEVGTVKIILLASLANI